MKLIDKYKVRLQQLEKGVKEFYEGEKQVIREVVKAMSKYALFRA